MTKAGLFPVLLVVGCLISGVYGTLHNQISYSVSAEYFHLFKFRQFKISEALQNRTGASVVGWCASWWMGMVIGVPILLVGLVMPNRRSYFAECLIAFGVVTVTALITGLAALAYATFSITAINLPEYSYPDSVTDQVAFARAGTMHNFSYLGGFLGILLGSGYLFVRRVHYRSSH